MERRVPFFKSATVYLVGEKVFISPYARTRAGVRTAMPIVASASRNSAEEVGQKVRLMLGECVDDIPDDYSRQAGPGVALLLRETKQRSWSALHKKARLVNLVEDILSNDLIIIPLRRETRGAVEIEEKGRRSSWEPLEIGRTVIAALADAE